MSQISVSEEMCVTVMQTARGLAGAACVTVPAVHFTEPPAAAPQGQNSSELLHVEAIMKVLNSAFLASRET